MHQKLKHLLKKNFLSSSEIKQSGTLKSALPVMFKIIKGDSGKNWATKVALKFVLGKKQKIQKKWGAWLKKKWIYQVGSTIGIHGLKSSDLPLGRCSFQVATINFTKISEGFSGEKMIIHCNSRVLTCIKRRLKLIQCNR